MMNFLEDRVVRLVVSKKSTEVKKVYFITTIKTSRSHIDNSVETSAERDFKDF